MAHKTVHYGEAGICRGRRVVTHVLASLFSASWLWPRPRIRQSWDNQPRWRPHILGPCVPVPAIWNGKILLINGFKRQISDSIYDWMFSNNIALSSSENKIINSFFYPKQRTPCRGESRSGGRRRKIQIHWRLFNLAYGLKRNYLVKMKFYLFINWVGNTKRIKTFLILFLKLLALSSIGSSNQRFSLRFVCPRNKND